MLISTLFSRSKPKALFGSLLFLSVCLILLFIQLWSSVESAADLNATTCYDAWMQSSSRDNATCYCEASCAMQGNCCSDYASVSKEGIEFLVSKGLLDHPRRRQLGRNTTSEWMLERTVAHPTAQGRVHRLAVLRQCIHNHTKPSLSCDGPAEVVGLSAKTEQSTTTNAQYIFTLFNQSVSAPSSLRVAIGSITPDLHPGNFYYMQLNDTEDVAKALLTRLVYCGFHGTIPAAKKRALAFDPTPLRDWSLLTAAFSLRRGAMSPIDNDVASAQLDSDYDTAYAQSSGSLLPWAHCYLRKIWHRDTWVDVDQADVVYL